MRAPAAPISFKAKRSTFKLPPFSPVGVRNSQQCPLPSPFSPTAIKTAEPSPSPTCFVVWPPLSLPPSLPHLISGERTLASKKKKREATTTTDGGGGISCFSPSHPTGKERGGKGGGRRKWRKAGTKYLTDRRGKEAPLGGGGGEEGKGEVGKWLNFVNCLDSGAEKPTNTSETGCCSET